MDGTADQTQAPPMPGQPGPQGAPGPGGAGGPVGQPGAAPAGSPMSQPTGQEGRKLSAKMMIAHVAIPALEKGLLAVGSSSPEGQAILTALKALSKDFGEHATEDTGMNSMVKLFGRRK